MPLIQQSTYKALFFLRNGHWETIYPAIFRKVKGIDYQRERFTLSDGDFVDLDWRKNDSDQLILLVHGLEGNSERHYMKGMAKYFEQQQWDILALNCRSCSGEMNRKLRLYNHGEIGDLGEVIDHALAQKDYQRIVLIGFSMGASIIMKYLGVNARKHPKPIEKAVVFSAPLDLHSSVTKLDEPTSAFYRNRFRKMLEPKMRFKAQQFPGVIDVQNFEKVKIWEDFDNFFSAPINGFKNAREFYTQASAINYIADINIPTLLVNAKNDPILTPLCFPYEQLKNHSSVYFETPDVGGHVGFSSWRKPFAWSEYRAGEFVNSDV